MRYRLNKAVNHRAFVTLEPDERFRDVWAEIIRAARIVEVENPTYYQRPTRNNPKFEIDIFPSWDRRSVLKIAQCALRCRKKSTNAQQ